MDTPGVGDIDQTNMAKLMMDYLPNALAFVFVINVPSAGGFQKDRVSSVIFFFTVINVNYYKNMNSLLR